MKTITKSIAFLALFFLALSCTESEDSQPVSSASKKTIEKAEETKNINAEIDPDLLEPRVKRGS